ncbi:MAG: ABC transporter ATP-binding protein [Candidatus Methanomethylophilaceae archaeon]|nr:ABC transporter ATP-binding protein [Candidatus Methanomethylophilaceae archaeon]
MDDDTVFETQDLCYKYSRNKNLSIDHVNIKISRTKKTVLLGANGAGKSTLFYHFNGVFKPSSGIVYYDGKPLIYDKENLSKLRSDVAVVLQNPDDQIFSATVEEDVAFGPLNMGLSHEEVEERIDDALFKVGMTEYRMKPTQQLSYGQRKRVSFAGAIAMRPKVLILDEPTAGLDPQMSQELMELAEQLYNSGTTVIISTHDIDLAYAWADEINVLRNGKLVYSGSSEGFYSDPVEVGLAGLMSPAMYGINSNLEQLNVFSIPKYPKTRAQLLSKMAPDDLNPGNVFTMNVKDRMDQNMVDMALEQAGQETLIGIYGTDTRRLVFEAGLRVDYVFNGIENVIIEALLGKNVILCYDDSLEQFVNSQISEIESFGVSIKVCKVCGDE